jgi:hypothetical protein
MHKGFFSQTLCLLTDGSPTLEQITSALKRGGFGFGTILNSTDSTTWPLGGPSVFVPFRPEVNGTAQVDVVDKPWPDSMGDPKKEPTVFGAWASGHFGPFAYPGGLERAGLHPWAWAPARSAAAGHRGFIRIRTSYVFGSKGDAPLLPDDYEARTELDFLSRLLLAVFAVPGVRCYFNPNGEVLRDRASFSEIWQNARARSAVSLSALASDSIRGYEVIGVIQ